MILDIFVLLAKAAFYPSEDPPIKYLFNVHDYKVYRYMDLVNDQTVQTAMSQEELRERGLIPFAQIDTEKTEREFLLEHYDENEIGEVLSLNGEEFNIAFRAIIDHDILEYRWGDYWEEKALAVVVSWCEKNGIAYVYNPSDHPLEERIKEMEEFIEKMLETRQEGGDYRK